MKYPLFLRIDLNKFPIRPMGFHPMFPPSFLMPDCHYHSSLNFQVSLAIEFLVLASILASDTAEHKGVIIISSQICNFAMSFDDMNFQSSCLLSALKWATHIESGAFVELPSY